MIDEIFDQLTRDYQQRLEYAFDQHITQIIEYEKGYFIGVYVVSSEWLDIDQEKNHWSIGRLVCKE